jgi:chromosome segregation ATPase
MFKAMRKVALQVGLKKDDDVDAADKKRLHDLRDSNENLKRYLNTFVRATEEQLKQAMLVHESLSAAYPQNHELTAKVETLAIKNEAFKGFKESNAELLANLEKVYAELSAKHKELAKLADDRAAFRQDIRHYKEKIAGLEGKAASNPKEKQKLDENTAKLNQTQDSFDKADAELVPKLEALDGDIATTTTEIFKAFMESMKAFHDKVAASYQNALDATESPVATEEATAALAAAAIVE